MTMGWWTVIDQTFIELVTAVAQHMQSNKKEYSFLELKSLAKELFVQNAARPWKEIVQHLHTQKEIQFIEGKNEQVKAAIKKP